MVMCAYLADLEVTTIATKNATCLNYDYAAIQITGINCRQNETNNPKTF